MREFFGLIMLIVLLSIWSFVFAEAEAPPSTMSQKANISIERTVNQ